MMARSLILSGAGRQRDEVLPKYWTRASFDEVCSAVGLDQARLA